MQARVLDVPMLTKIGIIPVSPQADKDRDRIESQFTEQPGFIDRQIREVHRQQLKEQQAQQTPKKQDDSSPLPALDSPRGDDDSDGELKSPVRFSSSPSSFSPGNSPRSPMDRAVPPQENRRVKQAIQIADGIYIGDRNSSSDALVLKSNHITRILNTSHHQVINIFDEKESKNENVQAYFKKKSPLFRKYVGQITYLNFSWPDLTVPENLESREVRDLIVKFIEDGVKECKSIMIVSQKNQCRSVIVAQVYLMQKYKWSALRTLEFLCAKKSNITITSDILKFFMRLELEIRSQLLDDMVSPTDPMQLRKSWNLGDLAAALGDPENCKVEDEAALINSYVNSQSNQAYVHLEKKAPKKPQGEKGGFSIKELISDSIREARLKYAELQKILHWDDIKPRADGITVGPKYLIEDKNINPSELFQQSHFNRKKHRAPPRQKLTVVNEKTNEETNYSLKFGENSEFESQVEVLHDQQFRFEEASDKKEKKEEAKREPKKEPSKKESSNKMALKESSKKDHLKSDPAKKDSTTSKEAPPTLTKKISPSSLQISSPRHEIKSNNSSNSTIKTSPPPTKALKDLKLKTKKSLTPRPVDREGTIENVPVFNEAVSQNNGHPFLGIHNKKIENEKSRAAPLTAPASKGPSSHNSSHNKSQQASQHKSSSSKTKRNQKHHSSHQSKGVKQTKPAKKHPPKEPVHNKESSFAAAFAAGAAAFKKKEGDGLRLKAKVVMLDTVLMRRALTRKLAMGTSMKEESKKQDRLQVASALNVPMKAPSSPGVSPQSVNALDGSLSSSEERSARKSADQSVQRDSSTSSAQYKMLASPGQPSKLLDNNSEERPQRLHSYQPSSLEVKEQTPSVKKFKSPNRHSSEKLSLAESPSLLKTDNLERDTFPMPSHLKNGTPSASDEGAFVSPEKLSREEVKTPAPKPRATIESKTPEVSLNITTSDNNSMKPKRPKPKEPSTLNKSSQEATETNNEIAAKVDDRVRKIFGGDQGVLATSSMSSDTERKQLPGSRVPSHLETQTTRQTTQEKKEKLKGMKQHLPGKTSNSRSPLHLGQKTELDSFRSSSEENGAPQLRAFGNSAEQSKLRGSKLEIKSTEDVPKPKSKPLAQQQTANRNSQDELPKVPLTTSIPKTPRLKDKSKPVEEFQTEIQKGSTKIGSNQQPPSKTMKKVKKSSTKQIGKPLAKPNQPILQLPTLRIRNDFGKSKPAKQHDVYGLGGKGMDKSITQKFDMGKLGSTKAAMSKSTYSDEGFFKRRREMGSTSARNLSKDSSKPPLIVKRQQSLSHFIKEATSSAQPSPANKRESLVVNPVIQKKPSLKATAPPTAKKVSLQDIISSFEKPASKGSPVGDQPSGSIQSTLPAQLPVAKIPREGSNRLLTMNECKMKSRESIEKLESPQHSATAKKTQRQSEQALNFKDLAAPPKHEKEPSETESYQEPYLPKQKIIKKGGDRGIAVSADRSMLPALVRDGSVSKPLPKSRFDKNDGKQHTASMTSIRRPSFRQSDFGAKAPQSIRSSMAPKQTIKLLQQQPSSRVRPNSSAKVKKMAIKVQQEQKIIESLNSARRSKVAGPIQGDRLQRELSINGKKKITLPSIPAEKTKSGQNPSPPVPPLQAQISLQNETLQQQSLQNKIAMTMLERPASSQKLKQTPSKGSESPSRSASKQFNDSNPYNLSSAKNPSRAVHLPDLVGKAKKATSVAKKLASSARSSAPNSARTPSKGRKKKEKKSTKKKS